MGGQSRKKSYLLLEIDMFVHVSIAQHINSWQWMLDIQIMYQRIEVLTVLTITRSSLQFAAPCRETDRYVLLLSTYTK